MSGGFINPLRIPSIEQKVFPIGLGTWALGGFFEGGITEKEFIAALHLALDRGINLVDTAPLYGFGRTEEMVGKALKQYGKRDQIVLGTKFGLSWGNGKIYRDARKETVRNEVESSLKRLQVDYVDLYQLHWPDPLTPFSETAQVLEQLVKEGKIRAIGLSNFTIDEMKAFQRHVSIHAVQQAFNLFERGIEDGMLAYCDEQKIPVLGYGALCRGLLNGMLEKDAVFRKDDLRFFDPKFQAPRYSNYLLCVERLKRWADQKYHCPLLTLAIRWALDKGVIPLWGPKNLAQIIDPKTIIGWELTTRDLQEINAIIANRILDPIGPEFIAPPSREI